MQGPIRAAVAATVAVMAFLSVLPGAALSAPPVRQDQPAAVLGSGHAQVIAQGVVALPPGDAVWRTVRTRAALPDDAAFEPRPLGFVLATSGPLLLTGDDGEQLRLGQGEAALVREGAVQRRASLSGEPISYLAIELVSTAAPAPPEDAIVLQPGQPFPAPAGLYDLDLLSDVLSGDESVVVPDTGAKNVILVTDGAANVGRPGGDSVVLLAGEAASFSGELQVAASADGDEPRVAFVVATIGAEVPAPPTAAAPAAAAAPAEAPAASTPAAANGAGSITVQLYACPPGMDAATLAAAVCAPADAPFDVRLSGDALAAPLTGEAAVAGNGGFVWSDLPFGGYVLAQPALPEGATSYVVSARNVSGDPESGYEVALDAENPDVVVRIYSFFPG